MQTAHKPIARRWHEWQVGEQRIIRTLDCYQVQSQVGKFRKKHPECREWRWSTRSIEGGAIVVKRIR